MVCAALLVVVGAFAIEGLLGTQGSIDRLFNNWIYYGLLLAAGACWPGRCSFGPRGFRGSSWARLCSLWACGDLYYTFFLWNNAVIPYPSVADGLWLAFYPVSYVALGLLLRRRLTAFAGTSGSTG